MLYPFSTRKKSIPVFQLLIYMSTKTFVFVHITYSSFSHLWKMRMHLYPATYNNKAAKLTEYLQGSLVLSHFATGWLEPPLQQYFYPESDSVGTDTPAPVITVHLHSTSECLHHWLGQGDGLEVTTFSFEVKDKKWGYWNFLDGSPVDLQLLLPWHLKNNDSDLPLTTTFTVTKAAQKQS